MPFISDADFAQFQQLKSGGGGAAPGAVRPAWQAPSSGALPGPVAQFYGMPDYTAQNAEIARRSRAAMSDPNSATYQSPEQQAKVANANAMQAKANPGWNWNESAGGGGYWTPDAAHNNAASSQAFNASWTALGKASPEAFDMPTDAQGRPIDARTGDPMSGGSTSAQRAATPGQRTAAGAPPPPGDGGQAAAEWAAAQTATGPSDVRSNVPAGFGYGYSPNASMAPSAPGGAPAPIQQQMAQANDAGRRNMAATATQATAAPAATPPAYVPPATGDSAEARQAYYDSVVRPQYDAQQAARQTATGAPAASWRPPTRSPGGTY